MKLTDAKHPKSAVTRNAFLDAARYVFERKGYSGTQVKDITDRLQVARGSFYYYFRDKRHIFIELGNVTTQEAASAVRSLELIEIGAGKAEFEAWVRQLFDYLDRAGAFSIRSVDDSPPDARFQAAVAQVHAETAGVIGRELERLSGRSMQDTATTGVCVMAMMERSWFLLRNTKARMTLEGTIVALTDLIYSMVATPSAGYSLEAARAVD
ncbi:TetR/AcrR family transcriptional regulator [Rhodococcoides yunnanense]|uniref:Helix-turn-helix domain-containing protein n=1 Tax=Rhodococcoides yunnanense TaxID=278209 RepID=A0ABU4BKF4_9NOCA|nr:helix-turn-helix domain-containing protein [Rhodococcus yunnanensis]MDV6264697.1 helix-turn-helix domain-containing protein [Rhodococcus yunnanensis]